MELYDVVLFVHVVSVIAAFGVTFAYPIMGPFVTRADPRALPVFHRAQALVGKRLISLGLLLALLSGIYLATDRDLWSEMWVSIPMLIIIVLGGLGGAFFGPQESRAAELAERDIAASGDAVELSAEYRAVAARIVGVGALASFLVVVAVFFMVVKP